MVRSLSTSGLAPKQQVQFWSDALTDLLRSWVERLQLPRLAHFGVTEGHVDQIAAASRGGSIRSNPVVLSDAELVSLLQSRM